MPRNRERLAELQTALDEYETEFQQFSKVHVRADSDLKKAMATLAKTQADLEEVEEKATKTAGLLAMAWPCVPTFCHPVDTATTRTPPS